MNSAVTLNVSSHQQLSPHQTDEWVFPENYRDHFPVDCSKQSITLEDNSCNNSHQLPENSKENENSSQGEETQSGPDEVFTFSSRPRPLPHGRRQTVCAEGSPFPMDPQEEHGGKRRGAPLEDDFCGCTSSEEEYDWTNYEPSQMSESELQMLASMRRQQTEELGDIGASHGLSASQVDNCNVSISSSSDDTTTWNSCLPPPVNQGHHYQKEMDPPSPNPRDWLNVFSPPIVPPSQQPAEHLDSPESLSVQGEDDLSAEEDEEVLTLLYDPCLNCYFDPQTGKYYELA